MSDLIIEAYKKDVDRSLLRECLKLSPGERFLRFDRFMRSLMELREAGERHRIRQTTQPSLSPRTLNSSTQPPLASDSPMDRAGP